MRVKCIVLIIMTLQGLSGCSFSSDELGSNVGEWIISEARYHRLVGPPNRLIQVLSSDFSGDRKREVEKILDEVLKDVREEIIKLDETGIEASPAHERLPDIEIQLVISDEPYAIAVQGSKPRIEISSQLIENLIYPFIQRLREVQANDIPEVDNPLLNFMANKHNDFAASLYLEPAKVELLEALTFVIAHEVTHIWLDGVNQRSIESEIRADSYAVLVSSELSLTAEFHRKMRAGVGWKTETENFGSATATTFTWKTSDPISIIMMNVQMGGATLFEVYENSAFSEGDASHLPIKERLARVSVELDEILEKRANETTVLESAFWVLANGLFFE